jgi:hypothetical protein
MQAQDAAGVTHGFSSLYGSDCNTGLVIRYFQGTGAGWTVEDTPFRGFVVGWTTQAAVFRAFVAERTGTAWTGATASPAVPRLQFLTGLTTGGGDGHRDHRQPRLPALLGHRDLTGRATAS